MARAADIFMSCRLGDLEKIQYLTEEKEINLNVRDQWDSTPLYYACLCGHLDVVLYLLSNGARCDAATFDGERCIYGALSDEIRRTLLSFSVLTSRVRRREPYHEFLRKLLDEAADHGDVTFVVHEVRARAHRCVLASRSDYFGEQFESRWRDREVVSIQHTLVDSAAFLLLLEWIYTGQAKVEVALIDDLHRLCKQCRLSSLQHELEEAIKKADSFVACKRGMKIRHVQIESDASEEDLQADLWALAQAGMPEVFQSGWNELPLFDCEKRMLPSNRFYDLVFVVQNFAFHGHKAFYTTRSDYFKALIRDHFHENNVNPRNGLLTIPLHCVSAEVFAAVHSHVYSNTQERLTPENVYEVLEAADIFLLPGLERKCGNYLCQFIDVDNVVSFLQTGRLYDLPRLQHQCTEYMAANVEQLVAREDFRELVLSDAANVQSRQETDSIDIVDEIRFCLKTDLKSLSALEDIERQLALLDRMLEDLGFDV